MASTVHGGTFRLLTIVGYHVRTQKVAVQVARNWGALLECLTFGPGRLLAERWTCRGGGDFHFQRAINSSL